jgi:hypothetical protein
MDQNSNRSAKGRKGGDRQPATPLLPLSPVNVRSSDPGDATARNFRYQHAYGAMLLIAAKCGDFPYVAIWCEHHEDFLAERQDKRFDGYQIKTSRPELGPWTLKHPDLVGSIGRFVDLVDEFGDRIGNLYFVSNKECDSVTAQSNDDRRRSRCPQLFLEHLRSCASAAQIRYPFQTTFAEIQAECGCQPAALLSVLHRVDIILGPSRNDFDAVLSHEHLPRVDECKSLTSAQLDACRDDLMAAIHRASSLQVTDAIRHLRALIDGQGPEPALVAKRLDVQGTTIYIPDTASPPSFQFQGSPTLVLGASRPSAVLEEKLKRGGLADEVDYMRERERAAEYNLIADATRRPDQYPALLRQVEQMVLGECDEAHLRARQQASPYGPSMLIEVQDRLRNLARDQSDRIGQHSYECLIGVAGLLTSECRVWWSPRFAIASGDDT